MNTNYIESLLEIGNKLSHDEIEIIKIASKFDEYRSKYEGIYRNSINTKKFKDSANWKHFEKFYNFAIEQENLNIDLFIESQFYFAKKLERRCVPSWLGTANSVKRYFQFLETWNCKPQGTKYVEIYLESIKFSVKFAYEKMAELKLKTFEELYNYRENKAGVPKSYLWITNGSLSHSFLSISKSYIRFLKGLEADIRSMYPAVNELRDFRQFITLHKKTNNFCKVILEDETNF